MIVIMVEVIETMIMINLMVMVSKEFSLGNTPLNESLIYLTDLLPQFKKKYGIEKMTLITLTDGGANGMRCAIKGVKKE